MTLKKNLVFVLLAFSLNAFGQPIEKSGKTEIEKKVETYIIKKTKPKYYHSIEFGEKKAFDLNQLIEDYEYPNIFNDEPNAFKQNKEAFEWLNAFNNEANIAYSMTLTYGMKEKNSDAWDSYWVIILFDSNNKIIGHFHYAP